MVWVDVRNELSHYGRDLRAALTKWPARPQPLHGTGSARAWVTWVNSLLREGDLGVMDAKSATRWEPLNVALASFYALGLQAALDETLEEWGRLPANESVFLQATIFVQLTAFTLWFTMTFLEALWIFAQLRPHPQHRFLFFSLTIASFVLFYFFGTTIGPVTKLNYWLVALILVVQIPSVLVTRRGKGVKRKVAIQKIRRRMMESCIAVAAVIWLPPLDWVSWIFAGLIVLQALKYENRRIST